MEQRFVAQNGKHNCITQNELDKKLNMQIKAYLMAMEKDEANHKD